jgi:YVTN family beta-propeller protein
MRKKWLLLGVAAAMVCASAGTAVAAPARQAHGSACDVGGPSSLGYSTSPSGSLFVINIRKLSVAGEVSGLSRPANTYVIPDGRKAFVDNWGTDSVDVIDTCTRAIASSIPIGGPSLGALSPDGRYLYEITTFGETVSVIDTSSDAIVRRFPVPPAIALAVSPDGRRLYVGGLQQVNVYDIASAALLGSIPTGSLPAWLALTPDGSRVFTANFDGTVTMADTRTFTPLATLNFGAVSAPEYVTITPDGTQAWVPLGIGGVEVISTRTGSLLASLPTNGMAFTVEFASHGQEALVSEGGPDTVNSNGVAATARAVSGTWVTSPGDIRVFWVPTRTVITTIPTGEFPGNVAIAARGDWRLPE